jgi:hypothetical protein
VDLDAAEGIIGCAVNLSDCTDYVPSEVNGYDEIACWQMVDSNVNRSTNKRDIEDKPCEHGDNNIDAAPSHTTCNKGDTTIERKHKHKSVIAVAQADQDNIAVTLTE